MRRSLKPFRRLWLFALLGVADSEDFRSSPRCRRMGQFRGAGRAFAVVFLPEPVERGLLPDDPEDALFRGRLVVVLAHRHRLVAEHVPEDLLGE